MLERPDAGTPRWGHDGPGPDGNHPPILATT
mgnify:CR=1 FL=1